MGVNSGSFVSLTVSQLRVTVHESFVKRVRVGPRKAINNREIDRYLGQFKQGKGMKLLLVTLRTKTIRPIWKSRGGEIMRSVKLIAL